MAYLKLGLTREELRERYHAEVQSLTEAEIVARFGRNPERFLHDENPERGLFSYNELQAPLLKDQYGREYSPYGESEPTFAFVKLPKSITLAQRHAPRDEVPFDELQDFPRVGDRLTLRVIGARRPEDAPTFETAVLRQIFLRQASGLLELSINMPTRRDLPDSRVGYRDEARVLLQSRKKLGLVPDSAEGDERRAMGDGRPPRARPEPRLVFPSLEAGQRQQQNKRTNRPRTSIAIPKIPSAPSAKRPRRL